MAGKLHGRADLKLSAADCHIHIFAGSEDSRNVGFKDGDGVSPDEDVVYKFAGEWESVDDLVGLSAPHIRASAATLWGAEEAVAAGRKKKSGEK